MAMPGLLNPFNVTSASLAFVFFFPSEVSHPFLHGILQCHKFLIELSSTEQQTFGLLPKYSSKTKFQITLFSYLQSFHSFA
jgi:hypothetical protein